MGKQGHVFLSVQNVTVNHQFILMNNNIQGDLLSFDHHYYHDLPITEVIIVAPMITVTFTSNLSQ